MTQAAQATLLCLAVEHTSNNVVTSSCPDTVVFSLDAAFFKELGESLAAVRLLSARSGEVTIPMPSQPDYFEGCPIDQSGTIQLAGHDWLEVGDLALFSQPSYKKFEDSFADPSGATDWDAVVDADDDSSAFNVSSTWLIVDQHGFQIESWEEHSDEKLNSIARFAEFPQIADRIEAAVDAAYEAWGIEHGSPKQRQTGVSESTASQPARERG